MLKRIKTVVKNAKQLKVRIFNIVGQAFMSEAPIEAALNSAESNKWFERLLRLSPLLRITHGFFGISRRTE